MKSPRDRTGRSLAFAILLVLSGRLADAQGPPSVRVREVYVPYSELRARTNGDPKGVVMTLDEYRKLLLDALRASKEQPKLDLPPIESAVVSAVTQGALEGSAVRLESRIRIRVTADGWIRCDLGPPIESLGGVTVDGKPGWIVIEDAPATAPQTTTAPQAGAAPQTGNAPQQAAPVRRAYLLLRGQGEHEAVLSYSLAVAEHEDRFTLEGPVVPAAASRVEVNVPGAVEASSTPPFLETILAGDRSRLVLSAGGASRFRIDWRRRQSSTESESLLRAEHWIVYAPGRQGTSFTWDARVVVARRKTGVLTFVEPAGATVVRVEGPRVHAWERTPAGLRVVLNEDVVGTVPLRFRGVVNAAGDRVVLAAPALAGAFANTGYLALVAPHDARLHVSNMTGAAEVAVDEAAIQAAGARATGRTVRWARAFSFASAEGRVEVDLVPLGNRFEARSTYVFRVSEDGCALEGSVRVAALEGRVWRFDLAVPPPWRLVELKEAPQRPDGPAAHGIRHELIGPAAQGLLRVELERALEPGTPLEVQVSLDLEVFGEDRGWSEKTVDVVLPALAGAERSRTDVGVILPESMDALIGDVPGWRSLPEEEGAQLGFQSAAAALSSRDASPRLAFKLVHRPTRGEYRIVSHLLALEDHLRVRADVRVAAVDRPIDELAFVVPRPAGDNVVISGAGIKELTVDAATGRRVARFAKPWLGTRQFRIEYEAPHAAATQAPIPNMEVQPVSGSARFGSERFIVLESRGAVEIETSPGAGLATADVDEVPSFGEPWAGGRIIAAYRFRPSGDPGTIRTTVHERAPVLRSLARELSLLTVLGADGVAHTRAEILLAYSRETYLAVRLPDGARCLSVAVNGEATRSVRPGARKEEIFVPLPPLSYAQVSLVYESPDTSPAGIGASDLGLFGAWNAEAPLLPGIPVGETRWTVHYPEAYRFQRTGGGMHGDGGEDGDVGLFAHTFLLPLLAGRRPWISVLERTRPGIPATAVANAEGNPPPMEQAAQQGVAPPGQLQAREVDARTKKSAGSPSFPVWPEGRAIEAVKLGGGARLRLEYRSLRFERFARRGVFFAVLLGGLAFARLRGKRACAALAFWALVAGTTVPLALDWGSPLVVVPACEGLLALLLVLAVQAPVSWLSSRRRTTSIALCALVALGASATSVLAAGDDGVLIPYNPAQPGLVSQKDDKVIVPQETFRRLWRLAHPDAPLVGPEAPAELIFGSAEYDLTVDGESYRLAFRLSLRTFTERWAAVPLVFDGRITKVSVDGLEGGVAQARTVQSSESIPFVQLKGAGEHRIEGEATGSIARTPGFRASSRLWPAPASTLRVTLPQGARLGAPANAVVKTADNVSTATVDLGAADQFAVEWTFPKVEGQSGSRAESRSFSLLSLTEEGYEVDRLEHVRITGLPLGSLEYRGLGAWQITEVAGPGVSEWSISKDGANPPGQSLKVSFAQPVAEAELRIRGRAALQGTGPLASLVLVGAARQESFVGLRQSPLRRFAQQVLGGMRRAAREELAQVFPIAEEAAPDRVYHAYGTGEGEVVAIEPVPAEVDVATEAVVFVGDRRVAITARSRYSVKGPGPLRHEVQLTPDWTVRSVQSDSLRSWELLEAPRRLVIELKSRASTGTEVVWAIERALDVLPDPLPVPRSSVSPTPGVTLRETQRWAIAASDELELSLRDAGPLVPERADAAAPWVELPRRASYRFALRSSRGEPQGGDAGFLIGVTLRQSLLGATVVSVVRVAEDFLHVSARLHFRVRLGGRDRFRFQLPAGAELDGVETRNERSRDVRRPAEGVEVEVILQSPVTGEHPVDVAYRVPRPAGAPPAILPLKVFDGVVRLVEVDQFVAVLQTGAALASATEASQLVPAEAQALPFLPAGVSAASLRPIFRATQLDWSLRLEEKLIEVTRSGAVVELAELTTLVGDDGTMRTRAAYTVRNKGLQFLLIEMPEGSTLWGVTLNGKPVAVGQSASGGAAAAARRIRVPLEHVGSASLSLEVAVQYEQAPLDLPALRGSAELTAPRILDTQVVETVWNLRFPDGYTLNRSGGNMREVAASVLYAKRAENLLSQLDKISKTAQESDSSRLRDQAARELARVEQALGDNLAELSTGNRSPLEAAQAQQIGRQDLEAQWASNDVMIERARAAQEGLKQARVERQKAQEKKGAPSREEQAFLDAANHLRHEWRDNRAAQTAEESRPQEQQPRAAASLDALLDPNFKPGAETARPATETPPGAASELVLQPGAGGLKPLPELAGAGLAPGLEAPLAKDGGVKFAFVNQGGDARVAFTYTHNALVPRLAAALSALILPLGALVVRLVRRRR